VIASIIPVRRFPKHTTVFDYAVSGNIGSLTTGQLVEIPFRSSTIFGIVRRVEHAENTDLKSITALVQTEPFFSDEKLTLLEHLATLYHVSIGSLLCMAMPPLQKRKLRSVLLSQISDCLSNNRRNIFQPFYHHYQTQDEHADALRKSVAGTTLILVPEVHRMDEVWTLLPKKLQGKTVLWHSGLSQKEQFSLWFQVRNGEKHVIVGTRSAVFLPFQHLQTVIIDYEHDENHKHWDQSPRFHAKDVAELLAQHANATLHLMSFSPSVESYYAVHKGQYKKTKPDFTFSKSADTFAHVTRPQIIDMSDERRGKNFDPLSNAVQDALRDATGDVFLFVNRLGYATSVGCHACGFVATSRQTGLPYVFHEATRMLHDHYTGESLPVPLSCPHCAMAVIQLRGAGTEQIESCVRKLMEKQDTCDILRIDSDNGIPNTSPNKPRIVIGTRMAFPHIRWDKNVLTVFVDIDKQINIPEFTASASAWHTMQEAQFYQPPNGKILVQTSNPKQLVLKSISEPDRFYRTDLNHRRALGYPPYKKLVRYMFAHQDIRAVEVEVARLHHALTNMKKNAMISQAIEMHPRYFRKQYWYMILVKLPIDSWQEDLVAFNTLVPEKWKVDVNPISILNP